MKSSIHSRLKVIHFISGDLWAGAETMACNLLRRLKEYDDLDLSVVLLNEGRLAGELRAGGLAVHVIDESLHSFREILRETRRLIGSNTPDIIHSHRYKENLLALLISGCSRGIRLVSTQHGLPEFHEKKPGITQRLITRTNFLALSRFFTTVAVSQDMRNALIGRFGFRNDKVEVIHNGIELPPYPSASGGKAGPFVIGSSGRLFPVKDYPLMVEIARTVAAGGPEDIRFELAGNGPGMPALQTLVQSHGLSAGFILKGHQDDMGSFYRGLDLYLNTSVHEGIPMTILEALAHGLPVIAPAVGGIVEIIDDRAEGFLIGSREPSDFAEKCLYLRNNPEKRMGMARAAREKAERCFSAEKMAEGYYRLYLRETRKMVSNQVLSG
ncbi:glycosyltransferase [Geobacter sp.]|uniref:glycosyltransferase n=1 Tax=Geobacter sp. TaxID=46610 RepID=UPI00260E8A57|nr:glycosyltransferase [Geobacter sp.]